MKFRILFTTCDEEIVKTTYEGAITVEAESEEEAKEFVRLRKFDDENVEWTQEDQDVVETTKKGTPCFVSVKTP